MTHRRRAIANVAILALCQALTMTCSALVISITALVGESLAPRPGLSTLPLALQFLALMGVSPAASQFMKRFGRRAGFTQGSLLGIAGGLVGVLAIRADSYALYCLAAILTGAFLAHGMYYRFAAADAVAPVWRSRAISLVMAGGVLAAVLGPQIANQARDLIPDAAFAGGYLAIAGLCALALVLVQFTRMAEPSAAERERRGRPLGRIVRQPALVMAVFCGMVGYGAMNLIMSITPPAMIGHAHAFGDAAMVIQWHVFAMFAPSFFTGHLIHRFGVRTVMATGAMAMLAAVAVNVAGTEMAFFAAGLVLLGLGWNFLFVGGTTLVTELHAPAEKAKVQAFNDVFVFATVAATALLSGVLYDALGWTAVNLAVVAPLLIALGALALVPRAGQEDAAETETADRAAESPVGS
jgi:predicted MFS family arabinose efflux permease